MSTLTGGSLNLTKPAITDQISLSIPDLANDMQIIDDGVTNLAGTGRTTETVKGNADALASHAALQTAHGAVSAPTASKMMVRDAAGRAQVAAPAVAADIARKDTVDTHAALTVSSGVHGMGLAAAQDYEEGTFTPVIVGGTVAGSHTYNVQNGYYRKVGNVIAIALSVRISTKDTGMSGAVNIGGLPFPVSASSNASSALALGRMDLVTLGAGELGVLAVALFNSSRIDLYIEKNDASSSAFLDSAAIKNNSLFQIAGTYLI